MRQTIRRARGTTARTGLAHSKAATKGPTATATLIVVFAVLILFALDIRMSGGTASFVTQSALDPRFVRLFLLGHIAVATVTAISWLVLVLVSRRRFGQTLPGPFRKGHILWGKLTFAGVCLLSSSGAALYVMLFAL